MTEPRPPWTAEQLAQANRARLAILAAEYDRRTRQLAVLGVALALLGLALAVIAMVA
jgi:hypothetical protein